MTQLNVINCDYMENQETHQFNQNSNVSTIKNESYFNQMGDSDVDEEIDKPIWGKLTFEFRQTQQNYIQNKDCHDVIISYRLISICYNNRFTNY